MARPRSGAAPKRRNAIEHVASITRTGEAVCGVHPPLLPGHQIVARPAPDVRCLTCDTIRSTYGKRFG